MFTHIKWCGLLVAFFIIISPLHSQSKKQWLHGIVRVNSDVSAGTKSFDEIAELAKSNHLDFVVFSDQFLVSGEYGIIPFKNLLKIRKTRPSISSFGIKKYLNKIDSLDKKHENIIFIPGADIAPHYYWRGIPFFKNFTAHQFSEQLTIFGPVDPDFYKHLPLIHNEHITFKFSSFFKLYPILFLLLGIYIFICRKRDSYYDNQGNVYNSRFYHLRTYSSIFIIIISLLWTFENRPFLTTILFNQYSDHGIKPYQKVFDYIRKHPNGTKCAVFWSAPEATMEDSYYSAKMITKPYLHDVISTKGHNGFAGIYGDARKAHLPGNEWDKILLEYCSGTRKIRPVVIGEIDYHGKKRRIDMYQTVVLSNKFDATNIVKAITNGNSYAYSKSQLGDIIIDDCFLKNNNNKAFLGNTFDCKNNVIPIFSLHGKVDINSKYKATITIILNGKILKVYKTENNIFNINLPIKLNEIKNNRGYIRFLIESNNGCEIISNPIFFQKTP